MKYQVDKDALAKFLTNRPAMIKHVTNLSEEFILKVMIQKWHREEKRIQFYRDLPLEFKTLAVTKELIQSSRYYLRYTDIPTEIRGQLSKEDRLALLKIRNHFIEVMENVTKEEWLYVVEQGYRDYKNIPQNILTQEMVLSFVKKARSSGYSFNYGLIKDLPGIWENRFAEEIAAIDWWSLKFIPYSEISDTVLALCTQQNLTGINIPEESWHPYTVERAIDYDAVNIKVIPKSFITKEIILKCADKNLWDEIPFGYGRDYETLVHYAASKPICPDESALKLAKKVNPNKFIPEVIDLGGSVGALEDRFNFVITPKLWLKILETHPEQFKYIDKADQTEEIVDAFLTYSDAELKDSLQSHLNLGKIKAHHAPLLIHCKSTLLQEIMNKHLLGDQEQGGDNTIEFNISPSEYASIKNLLTSKE